MRIAEETEMLVLLGIEGLLSNVQLTHGKLLRIYQVEEGHRPSVGHQYRPVFDNLLEEGGGEAC